MVRFIIAQQIADTTNRYTFTFQYGQIYYMQEEQIKEEINHDLHSNMVRFIITFGGTANQSASQFTFQYGQIYYEANVYKTRDDLRIYIPIWLDLL